ncbi:hypothetical protein L0F63_002580 [Massospora cicadina]|nr:hypothetical protein L0F63_002580 [Massospora cicadina]
MLLALLNICSKEELEESLVSPSTEVVKYQLHGIEAEQRRKVVRSKILAVGKMARVFSVLRNESESITELKNLMGAKQLPYGSLALGAEGLKRAITSFDEARKSDLENEKLPPTITEDTSLLCHQAIQKAIEQSPDNELIHVATELSEDLATTDFKTARN